LFDELPDGDGLAAIERELEFIFLEDVLLHPGPELAGVAQVAYVEEAEYADVLVWAVISQPTYLVALHAHGHEAVEAAEEG
jgi:hypothetical protein